MSLQKNRDWLYGVEGVEKHTFIITEKRDAAERIALALDLNKNPRSMKHDGVPYYIAKRDKEIWVVPALGHLYTVTGEKGERNSYPVFSYKWAPLYLAERRADRVRTWLYTIAKLAEDADDFIDACDYDIEGSIIGYCILKYACGNRENVSKRMKYSTLTNEELLKSYFEPNPHLDFALIEAGQTRHEIDWLYGINLSRALRLAAKASSGLYANLSTGRVQGPVLRFLVEREESINNFVPVPYWTVRAQVKISGRLLEAEYETGAIGSKREAYKVLDDCKGKNGKITRIERKQFQRSPPVPFDMGGLQNEAYRLFRYTPKRTAVLAQRLYLDALISYPRTSSQKLPRTIGYREVLRNLSKIKNYGKSATELLAKSELTPKEGKKNDPAHPAIYPTGNLPERILGNAERNLWDLVVRRFMAVFGEAATVQTVRVYIDINKHSFLLNGIRTLAEGWLRLYKPYGKPQESPLPSVKEGQQVDVENVVSDKKFTNPPERYNPATLLRKMEKVEIGTKATRADIIQTLYDREYVRDERMKVTDLGFEVLEVLKDHCPEIVSVKLTRELEAKMGKISQKKERKKDVIISAVQLLKPVLKRIKENEKSIGDDLVEALKKSRFNERIVGPCPVCGTGKLLILFSRKTGKRFIGCTSYFNGICKTSFPLPQKGTIFPLGMSCSQCGWPIVQVQTKGNRPWRMCINSECQLKRKGGQRIEMSDMQKGNKSR